MPTAGCYDVCYLSRTLRHCLRRLWPPLAEARCTISLLRRDARQATRSRLSDRKHFAAGLSLALGCRKANRRSWAKLNFCDAISNAMSDSLFYIAWWEKSYISFVAHRVAEVSLQMQACWHSAVKIHTAECTVKTQSSPWAVAFVSWWAAADTDIIDWGSWCSLRRWPSTVADGHELLGVKLEHSDSSTIASCRSQQRAISVVREAWSQSLWVWLLLRSIAFLLARHRNQTFLPDFYFLLHFLCILRAKPAFIQPSAVESMKKMMSEARLKNCYDVS